MQTISRTASSIWFDGGAPAVLRGVVGSGAASYGAAAAGLGRAAQLRRHPTRVARPTDARPAQASSQPL